MKSEGLVVFLKIKEQEAGNYVSSLVPELYEPGLIEINSLHVTFFLIFLLAGVVRSAIFAHHQKSRK